jgi:hypothetical protein
MARHPEEVCIVRARAKDAARLAPLFSAYLRFYPRRVRPAEAERFLRSRLKKRQSVIFLAFLGGGEDRRPAKPRRISG